MPYKKIIKELNSETFNQIILNKQEPSVIVFGAEWSGKSEMVLSMIAQFSKNNSTKVRFYRIYADKETELCASLGINIFPSIVFYKKGNIEEIVQGLLSSNKLEAKLQEYYLAKAS